MDILLVNRLIYRGLEGRNQKKKKTKKTKDEYTKLTLRGIIVKVIKD
jgi:hypothetical protein